MSLQQTWRLTIQPWQVADLIRFSVTRISYNKHGRQVFTPVAEFDVKHSDFEQGFDHASDTLYRIWDGWLAELESEGPSWSATH